MNRCWSCGGVPIQECGFAVTVRELLDHWVIHFPLRSFLSSNIRQASDERVSGRRGRREEGDSGV